MRGRLVIAWWRVRFGHASAERRLDVLATATHAHGWSHLKVCVESPPVLWVFPEGARSLAVGVTAERTGGPWAYRVAGAMRHPPATALSAWRAPSGIIAWAHAAQQALRRAQARR
ncbi:hypothetical protein AB0C69_06290 [Actinomadura sp. NPDC048032]|uniref:hypothetical protein n=1 Tax=Actinomadura sp. NPDC048032 TaxID=3155747 RepID=UPI0033C38735